MASYLIDFQPVGRRGQCAEGQSLLDCARRMGVELVSLCGGNGTCGRCKVHVVAGSTSGITDAERASLSEPEMESGLRLACQTYPEGDCTVRVPPESLSAPQRTQVEGLVVAVRPDPPVRGYELALAAPSLEAHCGDAEQLVEALERGHAVSCASLDVEMLRGLSPHLRSLDWRVTALVRGDELVGVAPAPARRLGLAVDLGTTKIAGYLLDLDGGPMLASQGVMNPQISYGEDVINRIAKAASSAEGARHLQELAVNALNELAAGLCAEVGAEREQIVEAVVVGNTAMHHLLLGLPVGQLALSPYVPAVAGALDIKARDIGLDILAGAYVHLLPNIAGFVGADHVAALLATGVSAADGPTLLVDIGTNTEVCLVNGTAMSSVSCASGPAFEGAHIRYGMRAASGAIEHVRIADDRVEVQTIGGAPPVGLCGSGILDALAQLYAAKIIGDNGRMSRDHPRVRPGEEGLPEYVLVSEEERNGGEAITITQEDVRQIQLAKAAVRTGIQVLLESCGCAQDEIEEVVLAGAFGSYLNPVSTVEIGMLPPLPAHRFRQVGNAAGTGARLALASMEKRAEAASIAARVGYLELAATPGFARVFAQANYLGRYRIVEGRREGIE